MNRWKISTFILALVSVGLLALNVSGSNALQGRVGGGLAGTPDLTSDETDSILAAITDVHDEVGYSTWTLEDIAVSIIDVHGELGYSTWDLDDLARHISDMRGLLSNQIEREVDNSTWTLSSLATKIATECR